MNGAVRGDCGIVKSQLADHGMSWISYRRLERKHPARHDSCKFFIHSRIPKHHSHSPLPLHARLAGMTSALKTELAFLSVWLDRLAHAALYIKLYKRTILSISPSPSHLNSAHNPSSVSATLSLLIFNARANASFFHPTI